MCFAFGFQQNHASELRSLISLVLDGRDAGQKPFVDLNLLTATATMEKVLAPVQLLTLIEMAKRELSGRFDLVEICEECHGRGEYEKYFQSDPEDMDTVYDDLVTCSSCRGRGRHLSVEARQHFKFLDKKSLIEARKACKLSYGGLYQILHGKRLIADRPKPQPYQWAVGVPF
jgi:hypothetical protein